MAVPPFERFYDAHSGEVFRYLVRMLGRDAAEDAFQETFLRALRGYRDLRHGEHLRSWVFTIATRIALDERRRRNPAQVTQCYLEKNSRPPLTADARPAYADLADLTDDLPRTERAAVVLRYGYDLPYAEIAQALGSNEEAARQATSSGVRRLRRRMT